MEHHVEPPRPAAKKNFTQTISLIVGFLLVVLCLSGLQFPAFAGLHLSVVHSLIMGLAGVLLFWNGYKNYHTRDAFLCCLIFGAIFAGYAVLGMIFGGFGTPNEYTPGGTWQLDGWLPNFSRFRIADHILNGVIALVLFGGAIDWWRRHEMQKKGIGLKRARTRHIHDSGLYDRRHDRGPMAPDEKRMYHRGQEGSGPEVRQ
jgi:hypothetical protein